MTNLIQKAIIKALELHAGQVRKGDKKTPQVVHPLTVGYVISHFTSNQDIIAAAILHDVVEDSGYSVEEIKEEFGENVAALVDYLTEDKAVKDWALRKDKAIEKVSQDQTALIIKAADCLANMKDLYSCLKEQGSLVWKKFNGTKEQKMLYYKIILQKAKNHLPVDLLEDYVATLKDIEYSQDTTGEEIGFKVK